MVTHVELRHVAKKLKKAVPVHVVKKLLEWVLLVEREGLAETRKMPGYHDEPLKGQRKGQRSIRLTRQWRAIYIVQVGEPKIVSVEEVMPHDY